MDGNKCKRLPAIVAFLHGRWGGIMRMDGQVTPDVGFGCGHAAELSWLLDT